MYDEHLEAGGMAVVGECARWSGRVAGSSSLYGEIEVDPDPAKEHWRGGGWAALGSGCAVVCAERQVKVRAGADQ